jgi:hypothetical protein
MRERPQRLAAQPRTGAPDLSVTDYGATQLTENFGTANSN